MARAVSRLVASLARCERSQAFNSVCSGLVRSSHAASWRSGCAPLSSPRVAKSASMRAMIATWAGLMMGSRAFRSQQIEAS
jgi:hypothetical protein